MSCDRFDPNCEGCRPAIIDPGTGHVLPKDNPVMIAMDKIWDAAPLEEQEAFWRVTVKNSRAPQDLKLMQRLSDKLTQLLKAN